MNFTTLLVTIISVLTILAWQSEDLLRKLIFNPVQVNKRNEYYRFLTSGFVHADVFHLLFNMIAFYSFGENVERVFIYLYPEFGELLYVGFFFIGIIISSVPTYLKHKNNSNYSSLGASGGVSSIIFFMIVLAPSSGVILFVLNVPAFIYGAAFLYYTNYMSKQNWDNVNHDAHMYGSLFGVLVGLVVIPNVLSNFIYQIMQWNLFDWQWL